MDYTARSTVRNASLDIYGIIPKNSRPQVGLRKDMSFSSFFIIQGQTMNSCLPQLLHILLNISFKLMLRPNYGFSLYENTVKIVIYSLP